MHVLLYFTYLLFCTQASHEFRAWQEAASYGSAHAECALAALGGLQVDDRYSLLAFHTALRVQNLAHASKAALHLCSVEVIEINCFENMLNSAKHIFELILIHV